MFFISIISQCVTWIRRKSPVYLHNELCRCDSSGDENDNIEQVTDHSDDEENGNIEEVIDNCDGHVCCLSTSDIEFLLRPIKTILTISLDPP